VGQIGARQKSVAQTEMGASAFQCDTASETPRPEMSCHDDTSLYSLTPTGWDADELHPKAVERWSRHVSQASPWSREYVTWTCLWADQEIPRSQRDGLRAAHRDFMGAPGRWDNRETTIGEPL
jgi:hypothetical protein